ncbi:MAG TPA: RNA 2',3'-cyclic phosphodiesterase [Candidatus Dormibacteraeota bacterium]|nr:RNA 2',3'-cyclic phosphodiesterase [Candidatus Dormibacteraeota bacterium]
MRQRSEAREVRLFVALETPDAVREKLVELVKDLRVDMAGVRWVRPENFHVTLKFIGEIAASQVEGLCAALATVKAERLAEVHFCGVGILYNARRMGVFWAKLEASPSLRKLAEEVDAVVESLGMARQERAFLPHVTVARFKDAGVGKRLRAVAEENADRDFGVMRSSEFHLIESKLGPTGASYSKIASFPFVATEES